MTAPTLDPAIALATHRHLVVAGGDRPGLTILMDGSSRENLLASGRMWVAPDIRGRWRSRNLRERFEARGQARRELRDALGVPDGVSDITHARELAARAGKPPTELRDELAGVKRERDNLRREVELHRTRSAEVSAARRQTAEVNGELLDARDALKGWQTWADRAAAVAGYGAAAGDPGQCKRAISGALDALKVAQGDVSGWRSWAMIAGRLPAVELIGARGDDGKLRAAVDVMLRIASGAEDMAATLSGPGALAEHVARLRDLAVRAALTADGAVQAGEALAALREIAEITGG